VPKLLLREGNRGGLETKKPLLIKRNRTSKGRKNFKKEKTAREKPRTSRMKEKADTKDVEILPMDMVVTQGGKRN